MKPIAKPHHDPENILHGLGPLYHKYDFFGVNNEQLPGIYGLNQQAKSPIITAYIALAIALSRKQANDPVSFLEMFCADGYYAMVASRLGASRSMGIDNNREGHLPNARTIAKLLNIENIDFLEQEISADSNFEPADIVANIGGLYHVSSPHEILRLSYEKARKFLIIQTVVSLKNDDEDYYESPAPGWTWGNRFSVSSFHKLVTSTFSNIVCHHKNELEGNDRLEDRASLYYLIAKS